MLASLRHPCVVQCIGATAAATTPWIVMEFLERTLYEAVRDAKAEPDVVRMLADVLSACAYLHSRARPIVHRDLKPPNVLADLHGRCAAPPRPRPPPPPTHLPTLRRHALA